MNSIKAKEVIGQVSDQLIQNGTLGMPVLSDYAQYAVVRIKPIGKWENLRDGQGPYAAAEYWRSVIAKQPDYDPAVEHFAAIFLTGQHKILGHSMIAKGNFDSVDATPANFYRAAIAAAVPHVVAIHNHPNDSAEPSDPDLLAYLRLKLAGEIVGINLIDAMVIGEKSDKYPDGVSLASQEPRLKIMGMEYMRPMREMVLGGLGKKLVGARMRNTLRVEPLPLNWNVQDEAELKLYTLHKLKGLRGILAEVRGEIALLQGNARALRFREALRELDRAYDQVQMSTLPLTNAIHCLENKDRPFVAPKRFTGLRNELSRGELTDQIEHLIAEFDQIRGHMGSIAQSAFEAGQGSAAGQIGEAWKAVSNAPRYLTLAILALEPQMRNMVNKSVWLDRQGLELLTLINGDKFEVQAFGFTRDRLVELRQAITEALAASPAFNPHAEVKGP